MLDFRTKSSAVAAASAKSRDAASPDDDRETRYAYRLAAIGLTIAVTTMTACYFAERGKPHYMGVQSDASNVRLIPF
jgi:hypothetical protein